MVSPMRAAAGLTATRMMGAPRGVDLDLATFDLATPMHVVTGSDLQCFQNIVVSKAFWECIDDNSNDMFEGEEKNLLSSIFNPSLCDRRDEGDSFAPPDVNCEYGHRLRNLVKEEDVVRHKRTKHFFSEKFVTAEPGPLFPFTWKDSYEVHTAPVGLVLANPDAVVLDNVLKSTVPAFDKVTEEGMRFRIYTSGTLEVRTTQVQEGKENVGVAFAKA